MTEFAMGAIVNLIDRCPLIRPSCAYRWRHARRSDREDRKF